MRIGTASDGTGWLVVVEDGGGALRPWTRLYPSVDVGGTLDALVKARWEALPAAAECDPLDHRWRLGAPVRPERNMICVGTNYVAHAEEFAAFAKNKELAVPELPVVFTKVPESLCGPTDDIVVDPGWTRCLDYEVELGVVVGRAGRHIDPGDALQYVAGYTVVNDTTARDRQHAHKQWFLGKSLFAATPIGPVVVTPDELPDLAEVELRATVDGEPRQKAVVADMIFDVATLISTISEVFPIRPGDVIATGTPSGVGISFDPPRYLADGAQVVCSIEGIGTLANRIVFSGRADPGPVSPAA